MHLSWFSTAMWISLGNTSRSVITHTRGRPLALVAWGEAACQTFSPFLCFPETFHALASGQTVGTTEVWYSDTGQPRHPSPTQSPPASCNPTDLLIHPSPLPGPPSKPMTICQLFWPNKKRKGRHFNHAQMSLWLLLESESDSVWVLWELGESDRSEQWVSKLEEVIDDP